jgi:hypothetical protein
MQSTGQTSTHEMSFVPMHGSLITYAIPASCSSGSFSQWLWAKISLPS